MKDLAACLSGLVEIAPRILFDRLVLDSRQVQKNDVFVALAGEAADGHDYIQQALAKGAVAILAEHPSQNDPRIIVVPELRKHLGMIASRQLGNPSEQMAVVGVTGTNGKSSVTHYLAQALARCGRRCGVIGTLGYGFLPTLIPGAHTTPDAVMLQGILAELLDQGAEAIAMEVSSHGLHQERVSGIRFNAAVFTNLTRDHLDYHGSMEAYQAQKRRLFSMPGLSHAIINADDVFGQEIIRSVLGEVPVIAYGLQHHESLDCPQIVAQTIRQNAKGFYAKVTSPWGVGELRSQLLGRFNISNTLAVLGVLLAMDIPFDKAFNQ